MHIRAYTHVSDCTLRPGGHCARESTRTARPGATRMYTQTHRRNTGRSGSADNARQELQSGGIKRRECRETAYRRLGRHRIAEQTFPQLIGVDQEFLDNVSRVSKFDLQIETVRL